MLLFSLWVPKLTDSSLYLIYHKITTGCHICLQTSNCGSFNTAYTGCTILKTASGKCYQRVCCMSKLTPVVIMSCFFTLCACQTSIPAQRTNSADLFVDLQLSGQLTQPETTEQIFALPLHTQQQLQKLLNINDDIEQRTKVVLQLIFSYAEDGLLYDNGATKTATETIVSGIQDAGFRAKLDKDKNKTLKRIPMRITQS